MNKFKLLYSKLINKLFLIKKYRKSYSDYYLKNRKIIYSFLREKRITNIKPVHKEIWKLWYNTSYYIGKYNGKSIFIKVMGNLLKDCFDNEILVNKYIDDNSKWLKNRKPELLFGLNLDNLYILVYENIDMKDIKLSQSVENDIKIAMKEFSRIGILHTDFGLTNIASFENKTLFIGYGTLLCPDSNMIRIRNDANYNHLSKLSKEAREICNDADFYYDDATHIDVDMSENDNINFLVGKDDCYYAKLGTIINQYKLEYNGDVYLLVKV